jgi:hypothetical protein
MNNHQNGKVLFIETLRLDSAKDLIAINQYVIYNLRFNCYLNTH